MRSKSVDPEILTAREVANLLKVHSRTVLRLAQEGRIPAMRLFKQWRFRRDLILAWSEKQMWSASTGIPTQIDPVPLAESVAIYSLFSPSLMRTELHARTPDQVLEELVGLVARAGLTNAPMELLRLLRERERLCSTGLEHGVAIPHPRLAVPGLVRSTVIAYGRSLSGIDFGAIDGAPTRLFFLVCATRDSDHLKILARLSYLFRDALFREQFANLDRPEEVIEALRRRAAQKGERIETVLSLRPYPEESMGLPESDKS